MGFSKVVGGVRPLTQLHNVVFFFVFSFLGVGGPSIVWGVLFEIGIQSARIKGDEVRQGMSPIRDDAEAVGGGEQEYFLEGAFRNVHSRLRTHAESIAFFGGGEREAKTIEKYFNDLITHLYRVIDIRYDC